MTVVPTVVLASASAARARMIGNAGVSFDIDAAAIDEVAVKEAARVAGCNVTEAAKQLASAKALVVAARHPDCLVIGADQMLECEHRWFDKPRDREDARENLIFLRGREHHLVSGVAVARDGQVLWSAVDVARLRMRNFSDRFLEHYLEHAGAAVTESVGACKLEGLGIQFFERIDGDFFTILGMPLLPLLAFLRRHSVVAE